MFETKTPDELSSTPLNGESYRYHCNRYIVNANAEINKLNGDIASFMMRELKKDGEIDRLNDELAALRPQSAVFEKVTGKVFPVKGVYFVTHKETGLHEAYIATAGAEVSEFFEYTLILAEADFPVPPKPELPLEVKVGKYADTEGDVMRVLAIVEGYVLYTIEDESYASSVRGVREYLSAHNARFIGEGDNQ